MKIINTFVLLILFSSCQITETINISADGTGNIEIYSLRDENSYRQLGANLHNGEKFKDTAFVFRDYIAKYNDTFVKFSKSDQALFQEHANVKMQIKADPIQVEHFNIVSFDFRKLEEIPNLYESLGLANSLEENYPVSKQFFKIKCTFDGSVFKRNILITDKEKFDQERKDFEKGKEKFFKYKLVQSYIQNYHFPRKIKSVSNQKAIISEDKKSMKLEFQLSDCLQNPESTNFEVILE